MCSVCGLPRQVKWDRGNDDALVGDERSAQACGGAVMQDPLPVLGNDDLGHDEREDHVGALAVQCSYVVGQRRDGGAVWGHDNLERQMLAPRMPRAVEALGL